MYAYKVRNFQVADTAALAALKDIPYDIQAKAEGETAPSEMEFRQMLRSLPAERFQLRVHGEMRETAVYALTAGKNGPKFRESRADVSSTGHIGISGRNNVVTLPRITMADFAAELANAFLDRPVVDRTGLTGTYEITLTYTPQNKVMRGEPDPADISIWTALQEQLGLRLVPKAEIEFLAVEHVEKPTAN
jgi:uncharacterized protein (TIGR03435 family)